MYNNTLILNKSLDKYVDMNIYINIYDAIFMNIFIIIIYIIIDSKSILNCYKNSKKNKNSENLKKSKKVLYNDEVYDLELDINLDKFDYYP